MALQWDPEASSFTRRVAKFCEMPVQRSKPQHGFRVSQLLFQVPPVETPLYQNASTNVAQNIVEDALGGRCDNGCVSFEEKGLVEN